MSTYAWPPSTSPRRLRTRVCLRRPGSSPATRPAAIERGLEQIQGEIERGEFVWQRELEDVHLNIEMRLTALVGDAGKRLHTARSRNDQVATDARLWLRGAIDVLGERLRAASPRPRRSRRAPCRYHHARLDAPAGGATGHLRPSPARLRGNAGTRRRASRRLPPPRQPLATGQRGAGRHELSDRSTARRRRTWLRSALRRIRSTLFPTAISPSNSQPPRH